MRQVVQILGHYDSTDSYYEINSQSGLLKEDWEAGRLREAWDQVPESDRLLRGKMRALMSRLGVMVDGKHLDQFVVYYLVTLRRGPGQRVPVESLEREEVVSLLMEYKSQLGRVATVEEYEGDFEDSQEIQVYQHEQENGQMAIDGFQDSLDQAILEETDDKSADDDDDDYQGDLLLD